MPTPTSEDEARSIGGRRLAEAALGGPSAGALDGALVSSSLADASGVLAMYTDRFMYTLSGAQAGTGPVQQYLLFIV